VLRWPHRDGEPFGEQRYSWGKCGVFYFLNQNSLIVKGASAAVNMLGPSRNNTWYFCNIAYSPYFIRQVLCRCQEISGETN
jgi:hypothetical protein